MQTLQHLCKAGDWDPGPSQTYTSHYGLRPLSLLKVVEGLFDSLAGIFKLSLHSPLEKQKRLDVLSPSLASYSNLVISVIYFPGKCRAIT